MDIKRDNNDLAVADRISDTTFRSHILKELPSEYGPIVAQTLTAHPQPNIDVLFQTLTNFERAIGTKSKSELQQQPVFKAATHGPTTKLRRDDPRAAMECGYCHKKRHTIQECRKKIKDEREAAQANAVHDVDPRAWTVNVTAINVKLTSPDNSEKNKNQLCVDSGCTQHIITDPSWFSIDDDNDAPTVTVANGQTIAAQAVGDQRSGRQE